MSTPTATTTTATTATSATATPANSNVNAVIQPEIISLSRREEEVLIQKMREQALKSCPEQSKTYAECLTGRSFSIPWACRDALRTLNECVRLHTTEDIRERLRIEYINEKREKMKNEESKSSKGSGGWGAIPAKKGSH